MSSITDLYNVKVKSRYEAFLVENRESQDPDILLAIAKQKKEIEKENKSKAKKDKKAKAVPEKVEETTLKKPNDLDNKPIDEGETIKENNDEVKGEKSNRGRGGMPKRSFPGNRKNFSRTDQNGNASERNNYERGRGRQNNNRARNDYVANNLEDNEEGNRGGPPRRRGGRGRGRGNYQNEKKTNDLEFDNNRSDEFPNQISNFEESQQENLPPRRADRGGRGRQFVRNRAPRGGGNRFNRPFNEEETGGGNRDIDNNVQQENINNKMGYFNHNENASGDFEKRPASFRGQRGGGRGFRRNNRGGPDRGNRGPRGNRGGFRRNGDDDKQRFQSQDPTQNNQFSVDNQPVEKWQDYEDTGVTESGISGGMNFEAQQPLQSSPFSPDLISNLEPQQSQPDAMVDIKQSNWDEIEDDHCDEHKQMTLHEYKATQQQSHQLLNNMNNRKANDGRDVFSGMEEYRKEGVNNRFYDEQTGTNQNFSEDNSNFRQKGNDFPMSIRFCKSGGGGMNQHGMAQNDNNFGSAQPRQGSGGYSNRGGGNYFRSRGGRGVPNRRRYPQGNNPSGSFNRQQNSSYSDSRYDFDNQGSRGGGPRGPGVIGKFNNQQMSQVPPSYNNINLGNEEEFPTLA